MLHGLCIGAMMCVFGVFCLWWVWGVFCVLGLMGELIENKNISLTKGCAKDIISPLGCNSPVMGELGWFGSST